MKKIFCFAVLLACFMGVSQAQVTVAPITNPRVQFFNNSVPCAGCLLDTFAAGTTTPLATYSESTGTTPNANPVVLGSDGSAVVYLTSASYKFRLRTALGVTIWTQDVISWNTPLTTFAGLTDAGALTQTQPTAATNVANQSSFSDCMNATYWTGAVSATDSWCLQDILGTGSNPASTFTLTHSGSSGASTFSIPGNVSVGGTLGAKNDEQIRIASQFGGADWCANVTLADTNLGANAGEIWVDANQAISACASMFTLTAQHRLRFTQGGQYKVSNKLNVPAGGSIYGLGGGPGETSQVLTNTVTISAISGTFPTSTAVVAYHDVAHTELNGVNIDCQNISNAIGLLYDSDNTPPSSLNTFFNFVIKGCHQSVVVGIPSNVATAPASCQGNPNQSGCFQMDTDKFENFQIYGNCSDLTGEGFHINSANGMQNSVIHRGNIQCVNIGLHTISTNGTFRFDNTNGGSPVGITPTYILTEINVAQSADMLGNESEGGGWTGGAVVDHSCNPLGTNGSPTWIGNAFNGNNVTVDGCEQVTDIGSNNTASLTFTVAGTAHVIALNTSKWSVSGSGELSTWNLGAIQTQQMSVTNGNGVQYCTGSFATCAKIKNDTAGGLTMTSNGLKSWGFQNGGVTAFPAGFNMTEGTAQSANAGQDECYADSTAHALKCSYNNGSFFNVPLVGTTNIFSATQTFNNGPVAGGTAAALTGTGACATITTQTGGSWAGRATCTGTTGASTLTITPGTTAPNGWVCNVQDQTTRANLFQQTGTVAASCTLTVTSVTQNDVFVFSAIAF